MNDLRVPPPAVGPAEACGGIRADLGPAFEGEAMHGYLGAVQLADGTPVVLKLGRRNEESAGEPLALSTWAGRVAALLLDSAPDDGGRLPERLDAGRPLDDLRSTKPSRSSATWRADSRRAG